MATQATLADLEAIVRRDPTWVDTTFLSKANLDTILLEGALDMARRAKALPLKATWPTTVNGQLYVLGGAAPLVSNFLEIYWEAGGLMYQQSGVTTILTHPNDFQIVSESYLDLKVPSWRSNAASDSLQHVYLTYDANGYLNLGVNPKSLTTGNTFTLWYLSRGTDMVNATDYPWTGNSTLLAHLEPYMKGIAWYALWQLYEQKALVATLASKWMGMYLAMCDEMVEAQNRVFAAKVYGLTEFGMNQALQEFGGLI